MMMKTTRLYVK